MKPEISEAFVVAEGLDDFAFGAETFAAHDDWEEYIVWEYDVPRAEWQGFITAS